MCQNIHAAIQAAPAHRANFYASENALFLLSRYAEKAFSAAWKFYVSEAFFSGTVQTGATGWFAAIQEKYIRRKTAI
jgi:hypothetical protein